MSVSYTHLDVYKRQGQAQQRFPAYKVVDLFAGPRGLGEGFASSVDEKGCSRFTSVVSIERDEFSHQTLLLRHFIRQFAEGEVPDDYYAFLAGDISRDQLYRRYPAAHRHAASSALQISLGSESHGQVQEIIRAVSYTHLDVYKRQEEGIAFVQ